MVGCLQIRARSDTGEKGLVRYDDVDFVKRCPAVIMMPKTVSW